MDERRCDLVLGGGGVRGLAHIGALAALEESGYRPQRVAGASAGAIVGAFAVAGVAASTIRELFDELDLKGFALSDLVGRLSSRRGIGTLVERLAGERVEPLAWITEVLDDEGVKTFGDLRVGDPDPTAPPERSYRLVVRCLDVVQRRVVRLPWDYARYGLDPDAQPVAPAVRASMSIPMIYDPVELGTSEGQRGLLVDGGLTSGFAVSVLDRQDGRPPRWPTFGIRLLPRPSTGGHAPDGDLAMLRAVLDALRDSSDLLEPLTECDERRTIRIDVSDVRALEWEASHDHALFDDGYDAVTRFLADWDFGRYRDECSRAPTR